MKNSNRKIKVIARVMLLVLLLGSAMNLYACDRQKLESGFFYTKTGSYWLQQPIFRCACKSEKREFDIEDVTLTFYYGGLYSYKMSDERDMSYPVYELYFSNDWNDLDKYLINKVADELISEKYRFSVQPVFFYRFCEFNYSVDLTIPEELFEGEKGVIWFSVYSRNINDESNQMKALAAVDIYYKKNGDTILLSSKKFS